MTSSFDGQASDFDQRTGLPNSACEAVVDTLLQLTSSEKDAAVNIVELGAGTGQIGQFFRSNRLNYIGLDNSNEMLELFRARVPDETSGTSESFQIVTADVNEKWPVDTLSAHLVFSSRAVHLFDTEHVCEELNRVASSLGLVFAVGRRKRAKTSVQAVMRGQMRSLLNEQGIEGRDGQNHMVKITKLLQQITTVIQ
ncbi:MAG: class I SAM-dependent methyltransferase, partial [Planctomycetota bacterium]